MAPATKTDVSVNGERTTLVFGAHYAVRYGKEPTVIRDGVLDSRAANGDLVFLVEPTVVAGIAVTKRRVRPSTIDSILDVVTTDTKWMLRDDDSIAPDPEATLAAELARQAESDALVEHFVAEGDRDPDSVAAKVHATLDDRLAREVAAALDPALPAAILAGAVRTGKAYADRNQVWKCGSCKGRTRKPVCTGKPDGSHPPVSAPAGKRLADRLGDR